MFFLRETRLNLSCVSCRSCFFILVDVCSAELHILSFLFKTISVYVIIELYYLIGFQ